MEDGLGLLVIQSQEGSVKRVLILIVMEDGLGLSLFLLGRGYCSEVLILVVMEYWPKCQLQVS